MCKRFFIAIIALYLLFSTPALADVSGDGALLYELLSSQGSSLDGWQVQSINDKHLLLCQEPYVVIMSIDGNELHPLWWVDYTVLHDGLTSNVAASLSPDGEKLAIFGDEGQMVLLGRGGEVISDTLIDGIVWDAKWTDDGSHIAYEASDVTYIYNVATGSTETLEIPPRMLPNGNATDWTSYEISIPEEAASLTSNSLVDYLSFSPYCMLTKTNTGYSSALLFESGDIITYPTEILSAEYISRSGYAIALDSATSDLCIYRPDGERLYPLAIEAVNRSKGNAWQGWYENTLFVLENGATLADFILHSYDAQTMVDGQLLPVFLDESKPTKKRHKKLGCNIVVTPQFDFSLLK